jgi:hypothetical protein
MMHSRILVPAGMVSIAILAGLVIYGVGMRAVKGDPHQGSGHPPELSELHRTFYQHWKKPNGGQERTASCCNDLDCEPAVIRRDLDGLYVRKGTDRVSIPLSLLEELQPDAIESPDGFSHACITGPFGDERRYVVHCAVRGSLQ